jgi:hypothetical protein
MRGLLNNRPCPYGGKPPPRCNLRGRNRPGVFRYPLCRGFPRNAPKNYPQSRTKAVRKIRAAFPVRTRPWTSACATLSLSPALPRATRYSSGCRFRSGSGGRRTRRFPAAPPVRRPRAASSRQPENQTRQPDRRRGADSPADPGWKIQAPGQRLGSARQVPLRRSPTRSPGQCWFPKLL